MIHRFFEMEPDILENEHSSDIEEIKQEFSERQRELSQLVYAFSHDLHSPLNSMLGLISVAKLDNDLFSKNELMSQMEDRVLKLKSYIKDITTIAQNCHLDISYESVNFKELIDEILCNLNYCDNFDKINFRRRFSDDAMIVTDPVRLKIILNNLLSNALKFQVLDGITDPTVDISLETKKFKNRISVSDNGIGIEKKYHDKIFEMFYRATTSSGGSGLGLYITKKTVERLDGSISVKSKVCKGTQFIVTLPQHAS